MNLQQPGRQPVDTSIHPLILFDGVCNFCNRSVNFLIRHDKKGLFRFLSLQSAAGEELIRPFLGVAPDTDSLILLEQDRCYTHSTAVLRIFKHLGGPWKCLYLCMIVPRPLRDAAYRLIARNRYRIWGKRESCMIPSKEVRERFLPGD